MKKTLLAAIALPLVCSIFFSCQSTDGAAKKADDASSLVAQDVKGEDSASQDQNAGQDNAEKIDDKKEVAGLPDAAEEKISESEMNEFSALLSEESASNEGASDKEAAETAEVASSDSDETNKAAETATSETASEGSGSLADKIRNSNKEDTDLARITNQGNTIEGGPLIGPSSNKIPGSDKTAGSNPSTPKNAAPNKGSSNNSSAANSNAASNSAAANSSAANNSGNAETNEAISLNGPQKEQEEEPAEEKPVPIPSRAMTIKNNQFVDVVYPGSGWIYLGEEGAGDHFIFQGRKLGNGETTFTLRSKEPGVALLHFYKNDILTGNYIDDFIEISVTDKSATDATHVEAPAYAEVVPPKFDRTKAVQEKSVAQAPKESEPKKEDKAPQSQGAKEQASAKENEVAESHTENSPSEKVQTVIQTSGQEKDKGESRQKTSVAGTKAPEAQEETKESALQEGFSGGTDKAKSLLERAQKAYDEKRYAEALDLVQQFFDTASEDFDAGLYLEGLILEAKSEVRNIKSAIGAYDTLIKNWPQSNYWRKANERSIYLKRFYIDIR